MARFDPSLERCMTVPIKGACGPEIKCERVSSQMVRGYVVIQIGGISIPLHACEVEKLIAELSRELVLLDAERAATGSAKVGQVATKTTCATDGSQKADGGQK